MRTIELTSKYGDMPITVVVEHIVCIADEDGGCTITLVGPVQQQVKESYRKVRAAMGAKR